MVHKVRTNGEMLDYVKDITQRVAVIHLG